MHCVGSHQLVGPQSQPPCNFYIIALYSIQQQRTVNHSSNKWGSQTALDQNPKQLRYKFTYLLTTKPQSK